MLNTWYYDSLTYEELQTKPNNNKNHKQTKKSNQNTN